VQRRRVGVGAAEVCRDVDRQRSELPTEEQEGLRDSVQLDQQVPGNNITHTHTHTQVPGDVAALTRSVSQSVLQPSSIRRLATPRTYFLHLSLSSVILTDSSTDSPVSYSVNKLVCGIKKVSFFT